VAKRGGPKRRQASTRKEAPQRRTRSEIPRKTSIVATDTLVSPKGRRYTILETDQRDPYDDPGDGRRKRRRR
jgi:hypothetical protein